MPEKRQNISKNLWELLRSYFRTVGQDIGRLLAYLVKPEQRRKALQSLNNILRRLWAQIKQEGIFREAGSLTYITILGFIPFIIFIAMLSPDLPFLNLQEKIKDAVENFVPSSAAEIYPKIEAILTRKAKFSLPSLLILIISSYFLFSMIRNTFDRILRLKHREKQDFLSQMTRFFGTLILGLLIMGILLSSTSLPLIKRLLDEDLFKSVNFILPFLVQFLSIFLLYMLMPSIRVKRGSLYRGAFWTTVLWVLVKSGFDFYILQFTNFKAIYGVLGVVPVFLLWIWVNWIILLGGIVLVSVLENKEDGGRDEPENKRKLRLTLEFYANDKLERKLESFLGREELTELAEQFGEEPNEA